MASGEDVEGLVVSLLRAHRMDPSEPGDPWQLAIATLGPRVFDVPRGLAKCGAHGYRMPDGWRIAVDERLPVEEQAHAVGHEIGHAILRALGAPDTEAACDLFGAAVLLPLPFARRYHRRRGLDVRGLARAAACSPSCAALRIGEAAGVPTVLVSPTLTRHRGRPPERSSRASTHRIGAGRVAVFAP